MTWLDHFFLPRNSKFQFDQKDRGEHSQPVGKLDDQTSQECESHEWPDALDLDDDQTTEKYLDDGRSPRVVSNMKIFQKTLQPQIVKHKNLLKKESCRSIHQIKKNKRKYYF